MFAPTEAGKSAGQIAREIVDVCYYPRGFILSQNANFFQAWMDEEWENREYGGLDKDDTMENLTGVAPLDKLVFERQRLFHIKTQNSSEQMDGIHTLLRYRDWRPGALNEVLKSLSGLNDVEDAQKIALMLIHTGADIRALSATRLRNLGLSKDQYRGLARRALSAESIVTQLVGLA